MYLQWIKHKDVALINLTMANEKITELEKT